MSIPALASYLAARARHVEAGRLMLRAERTMEKLAKRSGGSAAAWARACTVAGVALADDRCLATYRAVRDARDALLQALRGAGIATRLRVIGVVLCAELPVPANDRGGRG